MEVYQHELVAGDLIDVREQTSEKNLFVEFEGLVFNSDLSGVDRNDRQIKVCAAVWNDKQNFKTYGYDLVNSKV